MMCLELKTADEVRAHARAVQRRINAARAGATAEEPPPMVSDRLIDRRRPGEDNVPHDHDELDDKPLHAAAPLVPGHPTRSVLALAAEHFGLSLADIIGIGRGASVNLPRHVGFFVARRLGASLPKIGRAGHRDHTTVLHGCRLIEERIRFDHDLAAAVDAVGTKAAATFNAHWRPVRSDQ
jgi:hypothetical protein